MRKSPRPVAGKTLTRGDWGIKGLASEFLALAPKVYYYVLDGELKTRAKGVRIPKGERGRLGFLEKTWLKSSNT